MPYKSSLITRFNSTITQVEELVAIHNFLQSVPVTQVTDNILRAALTMLVSAIDTSIHELVINAVIFELKEEKSIFNLDNISIDISVSRESDSDKRLRLIEACLRKKYSKESFQSSKKIESTLSKIGITKIWSRLASSLGLPAEDIKIKLDLLVRRRNQIVHEGDLDHLHNLREISSEDLLKSLQFTKELINGIIYEYCKLIEV